MRKGAGCKNALPALYLSLAFYPSRTEAYCSGKQIPAVSDQRNPNTNNVGQRAADNMGSQPGNNELDIILGKKEALSRK